MLEVAEYNQFFFFQNTKIFSPETTFYARALHKSAHLKMKYLIIILDINSILIF